MMKTFTAAAIIAASFAMAAPLLPSVLSGVAEAAPARSAKSLDCSKQADAKGLHGKERRTFRRQCMRKK
jgi:hypothetical protein